MRTYAEHASPGLACLWTAEGGGRGTRVLPDACVDVIWSSVRGAFLAGPDTTAHHYEAPAGEILVGARFGPGAAATVLGRPLCELRDHRVPLELLLPRLAAELAPDRDAAAVRARLARLGTIAGPDRTRRSPADPLVSRMVELLHDPRLPVGAAGDRLGVPERTLRRRCEAAVGYGPKTLQRVLRLQRFLALAERGGAARELLRVALDAGYAHQSHLSEDCVRLSGLPPAALLRERNGT